MTRPAAARGGPLLGRGLLTLANVITAAALVAADWNDSHIFNSRWLPVRRGDGTLPGGQRRSDHPVSVMT
jgi:hypothetical protein